MRSDSGRFPRRIRQGALLIRGRTATWAPFWSVRRTSLDIPTGTVVTSVRAPSRPEWNVKRGGRAFGIIPVPGARVVCLSARRTDLELIVPEIDLPLVRAALADSHD